MTITAKSLPEERRGKSLDRKYKKQKSLQKKKRKNNSNPYGDQKRVLGHIRFGVKT